VEIRAGRVRQLARPLADAVAEHRLAIYASAVAFRAFVALVPLVLLGLAVLGAIGQASTWHDSLAPALEPRVTKPVFRGIDYSVERILTAPKAPLIALAAALAVWDLAVGVTAIMDALNRIHEVDETRRWWRRAAVAAVLAAVTLTCIVASILIVVLAPLAGGGVVHLLLGLGRWPVAALLLGVAVAVLVRSAPAEHPEARWASAGSLIVIVTWLGATLFFRFWVTSVADFKTAVGSLTALLVLTSYLFVSSAILLIGAELDELLRKQRRRS
jgi:membrane protein